MKIIIADKYVVFFHSILRGPVGFGLIFTLVKLRQLLSDQPVWFWCILQRSTTVIRGWKDPAFRKYERNLIFLQ